MSVKHVKSLIKQAAQCKDREGTSQMRLTQAALNAANAIAILEQLPSVMKGEDTTPI